MQIRETSAEDLPQVLRIHREAFGRKTEAELVQAVLADPSAAPILSLLAGGAEQPLAHALFSGVRLMASHSPCTATILAPLAVVPAAQGCGLGGRLVEAGLARLTAAGVALVFVLGDPSYYGRFGFVAAIPHGLLPPFPLPEEHADAWMVVALRDRNDLTGRIVCCDSLMKPELWQE